MNIIHLLYMDNNLNDITKMYDKLTYFDQYGGSFVLFIIITIIVTLLVSYFYIMSNVQPIIDDWPNQRCKPNIMPIAGFITHPEGVSAGEYTAQNFTYCTQNILSNMTGYALQPLTHVTNVMQNTANSIDDSLQSTRAMFDKIRTSMQSVTKEIMGRLMNIMTPLIQIIISFKDLTGKIQGTMTAGLFTLLGSYYTLKSLMGAIVQFIISILIALSVMIAIFWAIPFTWGAAVANTAIFVAIAVPLAIILTFMKDVLHIKGGYKIPTVKCFDKNTLIKMNDGSLKYIKHIELGDILSNYNIVTAKIKVTTEGSTMYYLNNVLVSDSHIVKYNDEWIKVSDHPDAIKCDKYDEKYLYCLNTTQKMIEINDMVFTDWDEIYGERLNVVLEQTKLTKETIHKYLDCGFAPNTKIPLKSTYKDISSTYKDISEIKINDIIQRGGKVYGIVEIDGSTLEKQYTYNLGYNRYIEGYSTVCKYNQEKICDKHDKLYHLLTENGYVVLDWLIVTDYNGAIDRFFT